MVLFITVIDCQRDINKVDQQHQWCIIYSPECEQEDIYKCKGNWTYRAGITIYVELSMKLGIRCGNRFLTYFCTIILCIFVKLFRITRFKHLQEKCIQF